MNTSFNNKSQEKTLKSDNNKPKCSICGSKRQRNLETKFFTAKRKLPDGTNERYLTEETRCIRCWNAYELLGNGKDRVHAEGSLNSSKKAYRYFNAAQADRVGGYHE